MTISRVSGPSPSSHTKTPPATSTGRRLHVIFSASGGQSPTRIPYAKALGGRAVPSLAILKEGEPFFGTLSLPKTLSLFLVSRHLFLYFFAAAAGTGIVAARLVLGFGLSGSPRRSSGVRWVGKAAAACSRAGTSVPARARRQLLPQLPWGAAPRAREGAERSLTDVHKQFLEHVEAFTLVLQLGIALAVTAQADAVAQEVHIAEVFLQPRSSSSSEEVTQQVRVQRSASSRNWAMMDSTSSCASSGGRGASPGNGRCSPRTGGRARAFIFDVACGLGNFEPGIHIVQQIGPSGSGWAQDPAPASGSRRRL